MKRFLQEFLRRGLVAASGGPIILAIIYGILGNTGVVVSLTPDEVCLGVLTITLMSFIAGGITGIYKMEHLPLISAILIHGSVLYLDYLVMYLLNNWIPRNLTAISIFTAIYAIGFALVWTIVYFVIKTNTNQINRELQKIKK